VAAGGSTLDPEATRRLVARMATPG
jgi:hypothetical protein